MTVNGGTVHATSVFGAAIGGGGIAIGSSSAAAYGTGGAGGNVTVNSGTLNAASDRGAAIGGGSGDQYSNGGDGATLAIHSGTVNATSKSGTGIGGGYGNFGRGGDGKKFTITGGTANVKGGYGAGVGGGNGYGEIAGTVYGGECGVIVIAGGVVNAVGSCGTLNWNPALQAGVSIGGGTGHYSNSGNHTYSINGTGSVSITGGTVTIQNRYEVPDPQYPSTVITYDPYYGVYADTVEIHDSTVSIGGTIDNNLPVYPRCGIAAPQSFTIGNSSVTVQSLTQALLKAPTMTGYYRSTASTAYTGENPVPYVPADNDTYQFYKTVGYPTITIAPSGVCDHGNARGDRIVTVGHGIGNSDLGAAHIGALTMDGRALTRDREYAMRDGGSVIITLKEAYLNSLSLGTHTLVVPVTGGYFANIPPLTVQITVIEPTVPKTGDDTPIALWAGLLLLTGAGIAVRRRRRA